jgi:cold shock CspA family protein
MARSQETFNKKEKENQKAKKRKEKALKKEERKSTAGKKSLEDMMAYVDENGNIVSAPPDPTKRTEVNEEDIQIGVAKREDVVAEIKIGKVSFFNDSKGYGFIKDNSNGESYFVHVNGMDEPVKENDQVTFDIQKGQKGWNAVNVKLYKKPAPVSTPPAEESESLND